MAATACVASRGGPKAMLGPLTHATTHRCWWDVAPRRCPHRRSWPCIKRSLSCYRRSGNSPAATVCPHLAATKFMPTPPALRLACAQESIRELLSCRVFLCRSTTKPANAANAPAKGSMHYRPQHKQ